MKRNVSLVFVCSFLLWTTLPPQSATAQDPGANRPLSVDWSSDGTQIAISTRAGITIYDQSLNALVFQPAPDDINYDPPVVAFNANGTRLLANNKVLDSADLQTVLIIHDYIIGFSGQWSPDGTAIAFSDGDDRGLRVYSATDGSLLRTFSSIEWTAGMEWGTYWSPDGRYLARLADGSGIYVLDAVSGNRVAHYEIDGTYAEAPEWSPDSSRLVARVAREVPPGTPGSSPVPGSEGVRARIRLIAIFDAFTGIIIAEIPAVGGHVWSPDGSQVSVLEDDKISTWSANTGTLLGSRLISQDHKVFYFGYSADGSEIRVLNLLTNGDIQAETFSAPFSIIPTCDATIPAADVPALISAITVANSAETSQVICPAATPHQTAARCTHSGTPRRWRSAE